MEPVLVNGDHVLLNTLAYGISVGPVSLWRRSVGRGDVVAFSRGLGYSRRMFLKRVIGLPGERIAISNGRVYVDHKALPEPYDPLLDHSNLAEETVPAGFIFVLGDNRDDSDDSRSFGAVEIASITGKAELVVWPFHHFKVLR